MTPRLPAQTERSFQRQVIQLARLCGWRAAHFRPARTDRGWRTPVEADGKGFPDLVLVRERVLWVELKTDRGVLTPEQDAWIRALTLAGQEVRVWRPGDWEEVVRCLN